MLRGDSENRLVRTFRPRRRKLGPELSKVYERLKDEWSIAEHGPQLDVSEVFGNDNSVCLEIGCGRGDLAVSFGPTHLDFNLIAIDIHTRGIANILQGIEKQSLTNTRVVEGDVLVLLKRFADASLTEVWVFFPDPWLKRAQSKNRLVDQKFAALLATKLSPGGFVWMKTDQEIYFNEASEAFVGAGFKPIEPVDFFAGRIYESTFERRFRLQGLPPHGGQWQKPLNGRMC